LLAEAAKQSGVIARNEALISETPAEVLAAMELVSEAIKGATRLLEGGDAAKNTAFKVVPGGPTRQQGQFLAFIREFVMRNEAGVAPTHAEFQRFFNLTAPSVNSMLIRLEQRGFIRRIPGKARAIELNINPDWIPPLQRPFKFHL